jgi:hypothetical protein
MMAQSRSRAGASAVDREGPPIIMYAEPKPAVGLGITKTYECYLWDNPRGNAKKWCTYAGLFQEA